MPGAPAIASAKRRRRAVIRSQRVLARAILRPAGSYRRRAHDESGAASRATPTNEIKGMKIPTSPVSGLPFRIASELNSTAASTATATVATDAPSFGRSNGDTPRTISPTEQRGDYERVERRAALFGPV